MKKSKLSVGLVTAFIGALALSACDSSTPKVTAKDGTIVDFVGYNNKTDRIEVKTGLYDEISDTDEGTKLYYESVLETLIRSQYEKISSTEEDLKSYSYLKSQAREKVDAAKQEARSTASKSGTSYDEEWQKILDSHDCKTEEDLYQFYLYDLEKTELTKWYSDVNIDSLKDEYIGVNSEWKPVPEAKKVQDVDSVYPYHILHILVTLSASKDDYVRGTITEDEAKNLWDVVLKLIDSKYDFQQIAMTKSDDTGSKDKYGDVEIMSTKTSFYNEFKLGIYAYDALLSGVNTYCKGDGVGANVNIYKALGLATGDEVAQEPDAKIVTKTTQDGETTEFIKDLVKSEMLTNINTPLDFSGNIPMIPYEVFKRIGDVAEEDKLGTVAPKAGDVALPRNILFNQFLNFHSPFVITDEDLVITEGTDEEHKFDDELVAREQHNFTNGKSKGSLIDNGLIIAGTNFSDNAISGASAARRVLTDKDNNVIIGVRSEAGIHFMVMRKSVFYGTNAKVGREGTSLQDYYTTALPSEDDYPENNPQTFINMQTTTDKSYYTKRRDTIKNELTSTSTFDAAFDYRLYEYLMDYVGDGIKFFDYDETTGSSKIQSNIEAYIKLLRESKYNGDVESLNKAWTSYLMMLRDQNFKRNYKYSMLSTTCALKFDGSNKELFEEGGPCYVEK